MAYFAVPKPRSTKWRAILNLKFFNENIRHFKFKVETFSQIREWIQPNAFLIGIDLKDRFLSVPINKRFRKFLHFNWMDQLLEWKVLPFGLKCSPRVVTKLLRPIMAFLRQTWSIMISIYMDDMIIQASSAEKVYLHAQITVLVLMCLGWEINWEKSKFVPTQTLTHLGFIIDTQRMSASCPEEKVQRLRDTAMSILQSGLVTVHDAEKLMGTMESVRPVTPLAPMHYRAFQRQLLKAKIHVRDPKKIIILSQASKSNLHWWASPTGFLINSTASLREPPPTVHIWADANLTAGGSHYSRGQHYQRDWSVEQLSQDYHINFPEVRAAREAVRELAVEGDIIRIHCDNKTACAYLAKQGAQRARGSHQRLPPCGSSPSERT